MRRVGRWSRLAGLRRRTAALLGGLLVLGAIAGGVAWATIPGGDGVIHGCYLKSGGTLRVIDASVTSCKKTETAIWWNVAGPQGPPSEPGAPGEPGPPGPGAAFADWNGAGGENYIELSEGVSTPILTLELPEEFTAAELVALSTVWITNWGDPVNASCTVISEGGGIGWPFTLQPGFNVMTFQGSLGGEGRTLELSCSLDSAPTGEVWAEVAAITAIPQIPTPD